MEPNGMARKPKRAAMQNLTEKEQTERFKKIAQELGVVDNDSSEEFERALQKLLLPGKKR